MTDYEDSITWKKFPEGEYYIDVRVQLFSFFFFLQKQTHLKLTNFVSRLLGGDFRPLYQTLGPFPISERCTKDKTIHLHTNTHTHSSCSLH